MYPLWLWGTIRLARHGVEWERGRRGAAGGAFALALALAILLMPQRVSSQERRDLFGNKHLAVAGFLDESAVQGQINDLPPMMTTKADTKPVESLKNSLKAQVLVGGETLDLRLPPRANIPGNYVATSQPTAAGQCRFRPSGAINGEQLDRTFESGPGRFGDSGSLAPMQFPNQVASVPTHLQAQLAAANAAASTARPSAIVGGFRTPAPPCRRARRASGDADRMGGRLEYRLCRRALRSPIGQRDDRAPGVGKRWAGVL